MCECPLIRIFFTLVISWEHLKHGCLDVHQYPRLIFRCWCFSKPVRQSDMQPGLRTRPLVEYWIVGRNYSAIPIPVEMQNAFCTWILNAFFSELHAQECQIFSQEILFHIFAIQHLPGSELLLMHAKQIFSGLSMACANKWVAQVQMTNSKSSLYHMAFNSKEALWVRVKGGALELKGCVICCCG